MRRESGDAMEEMQDSQLILLVNMVNHANAKIPITLTVPGAVVSGTLISDSEWLKKQSELVSKNIPGFDKYEEILKQMAEELKEKMDLDQIALDQREANPDIENVVSTWSPQLLNLENVTYLVSNTPIPDGVRYLWRGRISTISGWASGSFSPND